MLTTVLTMLNRYAKIACIIIPSNPLHPVPIYFLIPRKCAIFGVCFEAIPHQINFLINKAFGTGKGANGVISMLHFYYRIMAFVLQGYI